MESITKFLKWGLEEAASGVVGGLGGMAFDIVAKGLKQLVGFYSEEDRQKDQLIAWTQSVSKQLDILNAMVADLGQQMQQGFGEIKAGTVFNSYQRQYDDTGGYREAISECYNSLQRVLKMQYADEKAAKEAVAKLQDFVLKKELFEKTRLLANIWGRDPYLDARNIQENLADAFILSMGGDNSLLQSYCRKLETNFMTGVCSLYKAYTVLVTLANYKSDTGLAEPDKKTGKWLEEEVDTVFKPIADSFIMCTERLILSTYRPDLSSDNIVFASVNDLRSVVARSQLQYFQVMNMDLTVTQPGIFVREYLRPSMLVNDKATLKITANKKTQEVTGVRLAPPQKYTQPPFMPHWYKVVDKNADGTLVAFEDSDIIILTYKLPYENNKYYESVEYESPVVINNVTLGAIRTAGRFYYNNYNADSLEVSSPSADSAGVLFAVEVNQDFLTDKYKKAYPFNNADFFPNQFELDKSDFDELKRNAVDETAKVSGASGGAYPPNSMIYVTASFRAATFSSKHNMSFATKYPVKYTSKRLKGGSISSLSGANGQTARLLLANSIQLTVIVEDYKSNKYGMRACDIGIQIYSKQGNNKVFYFKHEYKNNTSKFLAMLDLEAEENDCYPNNSQNFSKNKLGIPITPGSVTDLVFEIDVLLQTKDPGGLAYQDHTVTGEIKVGGNLAWDYPQLPF